MKKYHQTAAFTLFEVIISTVVVAIIMLGIVTSMISLEKMNRISSDGYYVMQNSSNALNHILKNASLAVGSPAYPGFATGTAGGTSLGMDSQGNTISSRVSGGGNVNTFCFNQTAGDPAVATSNSWLCYTWVPPSLPKGPTTNGNIYTCIRTGGIVPAACDVTDKIVGTAKNITEKFSINNSSVGGQKTLFNVKVESCLDNTIPSCCDPGLPLCPTGFPNCCTPDTNNPYVVKEGSVSLSLHTAG